MFRYSLLGALVGALLSAQAPTPTLPDILASYYEARGGKQFVMGLRSVRIRGRMTMGGPGMEVPFQKEWVRPDKIRTEFLVAADMGVQAYDGKQAWVHMPFMGNPEPTLLPEDQLEAFRQQADFDGPLVDYEKKGHRVELVGHEKVEGRKTWVLELTLASGDIVTKYLDAETFLESRQVGRLENGGEELELVTSYADYKWIDGLRFPFSIQTVIPKRPEAGQSLIMEKIELNVDLEASRFAFPGVAGK